MVSRAPKSNVLYMVDWNYTLAPGGVTRRLLQIAGATDHQIDEFLRASRRGTEQLPKDEAREARELLLVAAMEAEQLPLISLRTLDSCGRKEPLFQGARTWFRRNSIDLRTRSQGLLSAEYSVVSGEFAAVIRGALHDTPVDVVGTECIEEVVDGQRMIIPQHLDGARKKLSHVREVLRARNGDGSSMVFLGDSYDAAVMAMVSHSGGKVVGAYVADDPNGEQEMQFLLQLQEGGIVHYVVAADYRPGSALVQAMQEINQELAGKALSVQATASQPASVSRAGSAEGASLEVVRPPLGLAG